MKKFTFVQDGIEKYRNVSPENEVAFFEKYGQYNPILEVETFEFEVNGETKIKNVTPENKNAFVQKYGAFNPTLQGSKPNTNPNKAEYQISESFIKPTTSEMVEYAGNKYSWNKEESFVTSMNIIYADQPVQFLEADIRSNSAVRIKIGDVTSDIFYLTGQAGKGITTDPGVLKNPFKDVDEKVMQDMQNWIDENTDTNFKDNTYNQLAETFYNIPEDSNFLKSSSGGVMHEESGNMLNFANYLDELQGIEVQYGPDVVVGRNSNYYDENGNQRKEGDVVKGPNSRLHFPPPFGKPQVDMSGTYSINGKEYTYAYLWKNRETISNYIKDKKIKNNVSVQEEIKHGTEEINNKIQGLETKLSVEKNETKIKKIKSELAELKWERELMVHEFVDNNSDAFLNTEPRRLKQINRHIELLKNGKTVKWDTGYTFNEWSSLGTSKLLSMEEGKVGKPMITDIDSESAKELIAKLIAEKNGIIENNNYQHLYDDNGEFIGHYKRWIQDPNNPNMMIEVDQDGDPVEGSQPRRADVSDDEEYIAELASNDKSWLIKERLKKYYETVYYHKMLHDNIGSVEKNQNSIMEFFRGLIDTDSDGWNNDKEALIKIWGEGGTGNIFDLKDFSWGNNDNFTEALNNVSDEDLLKIMDEMDVDRKALSEVTGGSPIAKSYNKALAEFKALTFALDLNINPSEINIESFDHTILNGLSRAFTGEELVGDEFSKSDLADTAEHLLSKGGYTSEPIQNNSWYGRGSEGDAAERAWYDSSANIVTSLTPLLAEIYVFKRLGGLDKLQKLFKGASRSRFNPLSITNVNKYTKSLTSNSISRSYKTIVDKLIAPAMITPLEWGIAEYGGELLLGDGSGLWDAHTFHVDKNTGEIKTNLLFPVAMGLSGGVFAIGSKFFHSKVMTPLISKWVHGPMYNNITTKLATMTGKPGAVVRTGVKTAAGAAGGGFTAAGLLTVASAVDQMKKDFDRGWWPWTDLDPNSQEGKLRKSEWDSFSTMDHFMQTTLAMIVVGAPKISPKVRKHWLNEAAKITVDTPATKGYTSELKLKTEKRNKDYTWNEKDIDNSARKETLKSEQKENKIKTELKKLENESVELKKKLKEAKSIKERNSVRSKINKNKESIKNKTKQLKEATNIGKTKREKIKIAAKGLHLRNDLIAMKKGVKSDLKYREYLKKSYKIAEDMLAASKSGKQIDAIGKMGYEDFELFLIEKGIAGKPAEGHYRAMFAAAKTAKEVGTHLYKLKGKTYDSYLERRFEIEQKQMQVEMLKHQIKLDPAGKAQLKLKQKRLEERIKDLVESIDIADGKLGRSLEKRLKLENEYLEKVVKDKGKSYKSLSSTEMKKVVNEESRKDKIRELEKFLKEGKITKEQFEKYKKEVEKTNYYEEGINAFISTDGKRIYVDFERALEVKSLGQGLHEVTHMLLWDYMKTTDASGNRIISEKGIIIIDSVLEQLTVEERKMVTDIIDTNYKWFGRINPVTGKIEFLKDKNTGKRLENKKETYYEEHLTVLTQLIKDKQIRPKIKGSYELGKIQLGQRLGKTLYPVLKKFFPKMYQFDINQENSVKAAKDLLKFLDWIATRKNWATENVFAAVEGIKPAEGAPAKTIAKSKSIYDVIPELKEGSSEIVKENNRLYAEVINAAKKKYGKDWKENLGKKIKIDGINYYESVPKEIRDQLYENNKKIAHWMADHPKYGGKGKYNTEMDRGELVKAEEFASAFKAELAELARTWNPGEGVPFGAYVFNTIKYRYPGILGVLKKDRAKSLTTEDGKTIDLEYIMDYKILESQDLMAVEREKRQQEITQKEIELIIEKSKLRNEIGITDVAKPEIIRKVQMDLLRTKTPTEKDFLKSLTKETEFTHYTRLAEILSPINMVKYRKAILEAIPIPQLVQMQKFLPQGKIFVKDHGRTGKEQVIQDFIDRGLLPEIKVLKESHPNSPEFAEYKKRKAAGVRVWERLEVNSLAWETYLEAPMVNPNTGKKSGTKGNNRENILKKLSTSLTKDAIPELLTDKAFVDKYIEVKDLKNQFEAKALIEQFVNKINRSEGLQFSKAIEAERAKLEKELEGKVLKTRQKYITSRLKQLDILETGKETFDRMVKFVYEVERVGLNKVYDLTGETVVDIKLKKEYKDWISEYEAGWVFENIIAKNRLFNSEGLKLTEILKAVPAGATRNKGLEQWVIETFAKFEKFGLKVKTEVQTELGDLPDVHAELLGRAMNIEVKMYKAQLGSLTAGIDIKNKKIIPISTTDAGKFRDINKINKLLESSISGWVNLRKYYNKLSKTEGVSERDKKLLKNFDFHNDVLPNWAFDLAIENGVYKKASKSGIFTEKLIEDMYKYKKYPSSHILWLGRGLLHLGTNVHGLSTQQLKGEFLGKWRHAKTSVKSITATHHAFITKQNPKGVIDATGLITTGFRFIPTEWNITNKNSKINITPEGQEVLRQDLIKKQTITASKSIENANNRILMSKSIENRSDYIYGKKKKRGMSTFDFDDTLASTKSGVRVNVPSVDGLPKPSRKVIFLAGGAGSGKGNVISKLELEKQGFKIVNSDISLEWLKKNSGLPADMKDFTKEQRSTLGKLGAEARKIARRKMTKYQGNASGVVVDGTGGSVKSMEKLINEFKEKGYDISMLFVETSLQTALTRNRARKERSLLDIIVRRNHESVQKNKPVFRQMFGDRFMEVKTDKLTMESPMPSTLVNKMNNFVRSYERLRLDAEQFALEGEKIKNKGGEFDFSEFNKVVEGAEGPFLKTAIERAKKYGTKDMFVLTARPAESAGPIREFLESMGLKIPIENITGLANSTGAAKAKWMLEKFKEGYNDMYFVDDALGNVKAVKEVLSQLDIKSKVVQAKLTKSKDLSVEFNRMFERRFKLDAGRKISLAEAKAMGRGKGRFDYFVPPSAEDFKGLIYKFIGKGKQGDADMRFFKEVLFDPFAKGTMQLTITKQKMAEEYKTLKKISKNVNLKEKLPGTAFTTDHAVRVYLWESAGFEIPGLNEAQKRQLIDHVSNNPNLVNYAITLSSISRSKEGYLKPGEYWMVESISSDLNQLVRGETRKEFLAEWINNKNLIFSPENMNKIEAVHGKWYREALENILLRMETGTNRLTGIKDGVTKEWYDWINGSVGATMFWNTRSAALQTISTVNFTNMADNNIFMQAKAFANQKQFWQDFAFIFNSPMLKQRRAGLEIDVSASELTNMFEKSGKNPKAILKYMLEKGFTPTRIADSFAIAMGGSGFYRNRLNKYIKQGLSITEAKKRAWLDFQEIAEETQQSSRPDLISQQQAGPLGRIILAWQNTPMQMTRLMKKKLSDLVNRRSKEGQTLFQSDMANLSGVLYYGAMQNLWFMTMQSGLAWLMFGSDMEDKIEKKELQVLNGALDTLLRGTGVYGAALSTLKNTILRYQEEREKGWNKDLGNVAIEAINLSPPIGAKVRKMYSALKTWNYNDIFGDVSKEVGLDPSNPDLSAIANIIEALFNVPLARIVNKANNLEEALTGNHETWQKIAMISGWNRWNVGAKDEELEEARDVVEKRKEEEKKIEKEKKKEEKKKQEEKEKKAKGIKTVKCSGRNSRGRRCGLTTETAEKTWKCFHHMKFTDGMDRDGDGIKEYKCTGRTKAGRRCKNKTENKNKRCYAHQ